MDFAPGQKSKMLAQNNQFSCNIFENTKLQKSRETIEKNPYLSNIS